jgi:type II secretory pathway pseudopilin PulG
MVIIATMAAWGVPQYNRTINRARARNTINNMTVLYSANIVFKARHNDANCPCANLAAINNINGANSLNIMASGVTSFGCGQGADPGNICRAAIPATFRVTADLDQPVGIGNPLCENWNGLYHCGCRRSGHHEQDQIVG